LRFITNKVVGFLAAYLFFSVENQNVKKNYRIFLVLSVTTVTIVTNATTVTTVTIITTITTITIT
jgi:hypothetical protein